MHNLLKFEKFKECDIQSSTFISEGHLYVLCYYECLNPINDSSGGTYPFKMGRSAVRIAISMRASGLTFDFTGSQFRSLLCQVLTGPLLSKNSKNCHRKKMAMH
jgi:hypothetical protein